MKETEVRIIIDKQLRAAAWRLPGDDAPNVRAEQTIRPQTTGEGNPPYANGGNLSADYVLETADKFPLAVLEAKSDEIDPLSAKEQARQYAERLRAPFVILSNGRKHYFWDVANDEPIQINKIPSQEELIRYRGDEETREPFIAQTIDENYIAKAQGESCPPHKLRYMRDYQIAAVQAVQNAAAEGKRKFLLEMATGTGKTLVSAAAIKLFLTTGYARRILFIVDRLELELQAKRNFDDYLGNSWETIIYKANRDDWNRAEIVISTVQTLVANDRYQKFSPLDFDLLIVDEAHRAIGGRGARQVFNYFCAYKLGLTATPKNYLSGADSVTTNPKEYEARQLRDTYETFGCEKNEPTYQYDLDKGVAAGHLISPYFIDARTQVTTAVLSEQGFTFLAANKEEEDDDATIHGPFTRRDYETKLFSDATNRAVCRIFLEYALRDPISGDIGKTIIYCVSQRHAGKIAKILNELAADKFPGKYQSDFALQVTSVVAGASDYTRKFANNNLSGKTSALEGYTSAKTRVCVTVGMMTAGYDCPDILNICFLRPIFSPSDFIQMRGRGTRPHVFSYDGGGADKHEEKKDKFMLFDFFAVCEHFEIEHKYDKKLLLNDGEGGKDSKDGDPKPPPNDGKAIHKGLDAMVSLTRIIFKDGMKVDRENRRGKEKNACEKILADLEVQKAVQDNRLQDAEKICRQRYGDETKILEGIAKQRGWIAERMVKFEEMMQLLFGIISAIKNREELLKQWTENFLANLPYEDGADMEAIADTFKACLDSAENLDIVAKGEFALLADNSTLSQETCGKVSAETRAAIVRRIQEIDTSIFSEAA